MADAPDLTLFHSTNLESRVEVIESRLTANVYRIKSRSEHKLRFTPPDWNKIDSAGATITFLSGYFIGSIFCRKNKTVEMRAYVSKSTVVPTVSVVGDEIVIENISNDYGSTFTVIM